MIKPHMKKIFFILILLHLSSLCASCAQKVGNKPQTVEDVFLPEGDRIRVEVWVENLQIPWSLIFLPDGKALVSERPGQTIYRGRTLLLHISFSGQRATFSETVTNLLFIYTQRLSN